MSHSPYSPNPMELFVTVLVILSIGTALLFVCTVLAARDLRFRRRGLRTKATIIDRAMWMIENVESPGKHPVYDITLEFTDSKGEQIHVTCSGQSSHRIGQTIEVIYDPEYPGDFRLAGSRLFLKWWYVTMLGSGTLTMFCGLLFLWTLIH